MELNTFQKQKIKFTFDFFLDYNKDGAIQWDDFQEMIKRYKDVNKGSLSDADYKLMLASLEDEWKDLKALAHANEDHPVHANEDHGARVHANEDHGARVYANEDHGARVYANEDHGARVHANEDHGASVSFDAYLAMWEKTLATCKSVSDLPTWCQKMIPILFKGMDVSGDGIVDLEEFGNYCKNFQLDCEDVPAVYDVITDGGKVTFDMNRYKELYFRLLTSPSADAGNALMGKKP
ncbi:sarcoplasmic calcium-binding proteins I, III, and IV-like isoform X2 [Branchiostoma floridae]|uniref:Sarcoplasmic calcium-binding proteins I, III, and IV-like isoform X2 n=1 Tax=Branchiostoma floridae TaxID=7739 RepID=A0A9J7HJC2_BRAFL|nr:sarcoplasmic calcium-binding proteins I, III, and IV-like isoform X2 [Branchiostoma floridae]